MDTTNKDNQEQGKQSEARTDATYDRNAEELKNSSTTVQGNSSFIGNVGTGGTGLVTDNMDSTREEEEIDNNAKKNLGGAGATEESED
ncbi:hypothetical protein [Telluribacter sp. SYSU D00476]|uniref:hypothetical protein n=1 Tax=Telluribacter sp. SYSU D00476 TaxID=2811430 RepID=UPI001FF39F94|nr:hypothetical protein [Telluribacter sp. SYSU D00476]